MKIESGFKGPPSGPTVLPVELGYYFPAEFSKHEATWLSWPHKEASWPRKISSIFPPYSQFVKYLTEGERVHILVRDQGMRSAAEKHLDKAGVDFNQLSFHLFATNDAWCRDHGPSFLVNCDPNIQKAIINWGYNAWGEKYPPYDLDNLIPKKVAASLNLPCFDPGIIMEGGSVEFNGKGTLLTTEACLLNPNRNPHLNRMQIEKYLTDYFGVQKVLWLKEGILGDDTDGHIDDLTRFVSEDTVVTVIEENRSDENYGVLQENLKLLQGFTLPNGRPLKIIELPMPSPVIYEEVRLPASYANFYIANKYVIVPTFRDRKDEKALEILSGCFPDRKVVGVDSWDIIWGLGSFHCLSQQEPFSGA
ncbi:MAG: agmatine deiminase family protein [Cyclobacteriaceae bacterium]